MNYVPRCLRPWFEDFIRSLGKRIKIMTTSFQKKSKPKVLQIPGAKPSLYNNQLLVSTGIPSLDQVVGGGVAVGSVLLIEEDTYSSYARLMMKYFCAEAMMTGHSLFLSSLDADPQHILKELPGPVFDDPGGDKPDPSVDQDQMKIAWRYKHLPQFQSSPTTVKFGHYYDLTKTMDEDLVKSIKTQTVSKDEMPTTPSVSHNENYINILKRVQDFIDSEGFSTSTVKDKRNILRIVLHSVGSPLWDENGGLTEQDTYDPSLPRFLLGLRAILRSAYAACLITIPTHLFCDKVYIRKLERLCDTVVHVDSFVGSDKEKNHAYKEYHGLFHIKKLPSLNSLVCHMPESLDLAFKLRRKKFTIEKLHLPPELSETASRSQEDPVPSMKPSTGCGTTGSKSKLDF